ncbi:ABC transporter permease [Flavobacterium sp. JP2137]|uniref:ABC transporter permease n=1 Tax=Flavobacterium sp. JP2137 TaxID=3414510 RepID=UPI003D300C90
MYKNWFKIYLHQTLKNKLFFFLNILGLAIGISALILAVLYWQEEHKYNAWNADRDRIFEMTYSQNDEDYIASSAALGPKLAQYPALVEDYCYFSFEYLEFFAESEFQKGVVDKIVNTQESFFRFFSFDFVYGKAETVFEKPNSIAISEEVAKQYFGNRNPVGKFLSLAHMPYQISGVYRLHKHSSMLPNIVLSSIERDTELDEELWLNLNLGLLIKANKKGDKRALEALSKQLIYENITAIYAREEGISLAEYIKNVGGKTAVNLASLAEVRLYVKATGLLEGTGNLEFIYVALSCALMILLLSIVNYINLTNAYVIRRVNELGIRKILGASNKQIVGQLVFETVINSAIAVILALVFVEFMLPHFSVFINNTLSLNLLDFWQVIAGIVLVVVLLGGLIPSLYIYRVNFLVILKGKYTRSQRGVKLRNVLLVLQFSIAFFFVVGGLVITRQVAYMATKELGYEGGHIVQAKLFNHQSRRKFIESEEFSKRLCHIKGVEKVALGTIPFSNKNMPRGTLTIEGKRVEFDISGVDLNYLKLLGIRNKQGMSMDASAADDSLLTVVVNNRLVEVLGIRNPVGKEFMYNKRKYKIARVVDDFFRTGFNYKISPMVLFDYRAIDYLVYHINEVSIKINSADPDQTLREIELFWQKQIDSEYPFKAVFLDKQFAKNYKQYIKQRNLFRGLNFVVVFISLFGLFALVSFSIESRLKEIVIRKVLGADTANLIRNLVTKYVILALIGFAVAAIPTYWLMNSWLNNFAYHGELHWIPFVVAGVTLLCLTLVVVVFRAYFATKIDLLKYLKYE